MTLVSNPNGVLIASTLFALSGLAVLGKAFLASHMTSIAENYRQAQRNESLVATWFGFPILGASAFLSGVGQFVSGPLGAGIVSLLLGLAFVLLLYAMLEGTIADGLVERPNLVSETVHRQLLSPPKLKAVELHDHTEQSAEEVGKHAVPI